MIISKSNVPTETQPWRRELENKFNLLQRDFDLLKGNVSNNYDQQASGFQLVGKRLVEANLVVPVGGICAWGLVAPPAGWLVCNGQAVSRVTYDVLFAVLGTTYGVGDGSTTFTLPNLAGRVPVGYSSTDTEFDAMAEVGGFKTHTLSEAEMPSHTHTQDAHNHTQDAHNHTQNAHNHGYYTHSATFVGGGAVDESLYGNNSVNTGSTTAINNATTATNNAATATNQNAGSSAAHNNLQPYLTLQYIIKY